MANKLYPPQLEGNLPAFYKNYDEDGNLTGAIINIPYGINRAVSASSITGLMIKIRTTSTNTFLVSDYRTIQFDPETNIASFEFKNDLEENNILASLFNEGQYYRVQVAFIDKNDNIGYYSTVGIIKCVAPPLPDAVTIDGYNNDSINALKNTIMGVYKQNTYYGDTTEKVYSYSFSIYNSSGLLVETSEEKIHDVTQDVASDTSNDTWRAYNDYPVGEVLTIQYTVTTLNGLVISSPMYRISKTVSVDAEFPIAIHATRNFENGYIEIGLEGKLLEKETVVNYIHQVVSASESYDANLLYFYTDGINNDNYIVFDGLETDWQELRARKRIFKIVAQSEKMYGESTCSGYFLITRASSKDNFFTWIDIERFVMVSDFPSSFTFIDRTVEQGIEYKYALQQYNIHGLESNKIYQTNLDGQENTVKADFEDMFLSDGKRQLKIRFNPKVTSFKNTIPEQKIETIGSKYPFVFRNGSVSYKEFPISGLISYQMDDAKMFLNSEELVEAGVLEKSYFRRISNIDSYTDTKGHEIHFSLKTVKEEIRDSYTGLLTGYKTYAVGVRLPESEWIPNQYRDSYEATHFTFQGEKDEDLVRTDRNLTTENLMSERYFKLKVLDWLTDGKVKLFRSPSEGNYLVRLLNVSLSPNDTVGRMLHTFTCIGYEIAELTYENLIALGLINESNKIQYEEQWATVNLRELLTNNNDTNNFIVISPSNVVINSISIQDFAPGDILRITYGNGDKVEYTIGVTGSLDLKQDSRPVIQVELKINPKIYPYDDFERNFVYSTTNITKTKFDSIKDVLLRTVVAQQFVGPQPNLLEPFILRDVAYGIRDDEGLVLNPISKQEGYEAIYNDLKEHKRFNYYIDDYRGVQTVKFDSLQLDYLHVFKRNIIPIFCYDEIVNDNSKFGITPFGQGYVNNQSIINYIDESKDIIYVDPVVQMNEKDYVLNQGVSIYDIQTLFKDNNLSMHPFDILKVFVYNKELSQWEANDISTGYLYYDCYINNWWDKNIEYNASFSINNKSIFPEYTSEGESIVLPEYTGDNLIYLNDIEELKFYNMGNISHLCLNNGVVAEISMQLRVVDYDIEEADDDVRKAKLAYLDAKTNFEEALDLAMENSDILNNATSELAELNEHINIINEQIDNYGNILSKTELVSQAVQDRIIEQKKQIWTIMQRQINSIVSILQNLTVYTKLTDTTPNTKVIGASTRTFKTDEENLTSTNGVIKIDLENKDMKLIPQFSSSVDSVSRFEQFLNKRAQGLQYEDDEIKDIEYLFKQNNNYIFLFNMLQTFNKIVNIGDQEISDNVSYDIVNDYQYIYTEGLEHQNNQLLELQKKNIQSIKDKEAKQGELVGGYLNQYDDENPPPENTLVYYDYQLEKLQADFQQLVDSYDTEREAIVDEMLMQIFSDSLPTLTESTDEYIQKNAGYLITLLNNKASTENGAGIGRIPQKEKELQDLQQKAHEVLASTIFIDDILNMFPQQNMPSQQDQNLIIKDLLEGVFNDIENINELTDTEQNWYNLLIGILTKFYQIKEKAHYTAEDLIVITDKINTMEGNFNTVEEKEYAYYKKEFLKLLKKYKKDSIDNPIKQYLLDTNSQFNAYCSGYDLYSTTLKTALETMKKQLSVLEAIQTDPGSISRQYGNIIKEYSEEGKNALKDNIHDIRTKYVSKTSSIVNEKIQTVNEDQQIITEDFNALVHIDEEQNTLDEKASIILNFLVDQYNKRQANTVNIYTENFLKEKTLETEIQSLTDLEKQIKNIESVYQMQYQKLEEQQADYLKEKNKINQQLQSILDDIANLEQENWEYEQTRIANQKLIDKKAVLKDVEESEDLFNLLVNNEQQQTNIDFLIKYLNWIINSQEQLSSEIGEIYANAENKDEYLNAMQKYINAYEEEAFKFLHQYDSLEEDLQMGFDNSGGMDQYYTNINKYSFDLYKSIFYLASTDIDMDNIFEHTHMNYPIEVRKTAYQTIKENLEEILLWKKNNKTVKIGALVPHLQSGQFYEESDPINIKLIILEDKQIETFIPQEYYKAAPYDPIINEENQNFTLLRSTDNNTAILIDIQTNQLEDGTSVYLPMPYNSGNYYLYNEQNECIFISLASQDDLNTLSDNYADEEIQKKFTNFIEEQKTKHPDYNILKWHSYNLPINISYDICDILYDPATFKVNYEDRNREIFKKYFDVTYKDIFNYALGLIIYDIKENADSNSSEHPKYINCLSSLRDIDEQLRHIMGVYFEAETRLKSVINDPEILVISTLQRQEREEEQDIINLEKLIKQCEFVNQTQIASNISDNDPERIQLLSIWQSTQNKLQEKLDLINYYRQQISEKEDNNPKLKSWLKSTKDINYAKQKYETLKRQMTEEYERYSHKVNHYLNLLFNNVTDGQPIYTDVLQNQKLLNLFDQGTTPNYNLGIAYAMEKYKQNKTLTNQNIQHYTQILTEQQEINKLLNYHYPLFFKLQLTKNIIQDESGNDKIQTVVYYIDNEQNIIENLKSFSSSYYYKDLNTNEFKKYYYIDEETCLIDIENHKLYYLKYPEFVEILNTLEFSPVPTEATFDINEIYYNKNSDGQYYINSSITEDNYFNQSEELYWQKRNGGILGLLLALKPDSKYLNRIKDIYLGSLDLQITLIKQNEGDQEELQKMQKELDKALLRQDELNKLISKFAGNEDFNNEQGLDLIIQKLAEYLRILTVSYVTKVERSYGVI